MKPYFQRLQADYLDQPNEVSLETLAQCNASCSFCPYPTIERKGTRMEDSLIDRLIGEMATFEKDFLFSPFKISDPLLDKRLVPLCTRMNEEVPRATIRIFTNGAALTPDKIDGISGLKKVIHLWVSLNSHIPEKYEKLMKMPFERTVKRLDYLHTQDFPHKVVLSCVGYPNEDFRRYCFDRWPNFESFAISRTEWLGYTYPQSIRVPDSPCGRWFELSVMANGIVSLCCQDAEGKYPLGDLNTQTMLEVYNAPRWRKLRENLVSRKQNDAPCSTCTYGG